jgi:tetratricopeptide (TPR) repeat protein
MAIAAAGTGAMFAEAFTATLPPASTSIAAAPPTSTAAPHPSHNAATSAAPKPTPPPPVPAMLGPRLILPVHWLGTKRLSTEANLSRIWAEIDQYFPKLTNPHSSFSQKKYSHFFTNTFRDTAMLAPRCMICLERDAQVLHQGCACRGDMGHAHVACLARQAGFQYATVNMSAWTHCRICRQLYTGAMQTQLAAAWMAETDHTPELCAERLHARLFQASARACAGFFTDALQQYRDLLPKFEFVFGNDGQWTLSARSFMAAALIHSGAFQEALLVQDQIMSTVHTDTVFWQDVVCSKADALIGLRRFDEASHMLAKVAEDSRGFAQEPRSDFAVKVLVRMGRCLESQSRYADAIELADQTLALARKTFGPRHPCTLEACIARASLLLARNRPGAALDLLRASIDLDSAPTSFIAVMALALAADAHGVARNYAAQEKLLRAVLEAREAMLGAAHDLTLESCEGLAKCFERQEKWAEAEACFGNLWVASMSKDTKQQATELTADNAKQDLCQITEPTADDAKQDLCQVTESAVETSKENPRQVNEPTAETNTKNPHQATEPTAETTKQHQHQHQPPTGIIRALEGMARCLERQEKWPGAGACFSKLLLLWMQQGHGPTAGRLRALEGLCRSLKQQGRVHELEAILRQRAYDLAALYGKASFRCVMARAELAALLLANKKSPEACAVQQKLLADLRTRSVGFLQEARQQAEIGYCEALYQLGRYADVRKHGMPAYRRMLARQGPKHSRSVHLREVLRMALLMEFRYKDAARLVA